MLPLDLLDDASVDEPFFPPSAYAGGLALLRDAKHAEALASLRAAVDADPLVTDAALATAEARAASAALRNQDAKSAVQPLLRSRGSRRPRRFSGCSASLTGRSRTMPAAPITCAPPSA